ncbi:Hypothetical predicted protein [Lecanosticta acicola]|uniref:Uncharacterized protein n=1 Tax=Lecanosticta acicola TaxID=111012 RepID=A0AAI9EF22_9PEZI|nr:Hypothetical predicted protein [Lecanosticta acicola]
MREIAQSPMDTAESVQAHATTLRNSIAHLLDIAEDLWKLENSVTRQAEEARSSREDASRLLDEVRRLDLRPIVESLEEPLTSSLTSSLETTFLRSVSMSRTEQIREGRVQEMEKRLWDNSYNVFDVVNRMNDLHEKKRQHIDDLSDRLKSFEQAQRTFVSEKNGKVVRLNALLYASKGRERFLHRQLAHREKVLQRQLAHKERELRAARQAKRQADHAQRAMTMKLARQARPAKPAEKPKPAENRAPSVLQKPTPRRRPSVAATTEATSPIAQPFARPIAQPQLPMVSSTTLAGNELEHDNHPRPFSAFAFDHEIQSDSESVQAGHDLAREGPGEDFVGLMGQAETRPGQLMPLRSSNKAGRLSGSASRHKLVPSHHTDSHDWLDPALTGAQSTSSASDAQQIAPSAPVASTQMPAQYSASTIVPSLTASVGSTANTGKPHQGHRKRKRAPTDGDEPKYTFQSIFEVLWLYIAPGQLRPAMDLPPAVREAMHESMEKFRDPKAFQQSLGSRVMKAGVTRCNHTRAERGQSEIETPNEACPNCVSRFRVCHQSSKITPPTIVPLSASERAGRQWNELGFWVKPKPQG